MKNVTPSAVAALVLATSSFATADDPAPRFVAPDAPALQAPPARPQAAPGPQGAPGAPPATHPQRIQPVPEQLPPASAELFPFVKYKDHDEIHPFAVETVVQVPHPGRRARGLFHRFDRVDPCCGPQLVNVLICVPPHCTPRLDVNRHGREYEFDYGEYAVDVRLKNGYIEVDYQD